MAGIPFMRKSKVFWLLALVAVVVAMVGTGRGMRVDASAAQQADPTPSVVDGGNLELDEEVSDKFGDDPVIFGYVYEGKKGENLLISLTTARGLKAQLSILTPTNTSVKFENGKTTKAVTVASGKTGELSVTLPSAGRYLVGVGAQDGTTGSFKLIVTEGQGADPTDEPGGGSGESIDDSDYPIEIDPRGAARTVVKRLQDAGIAPKGGKQLLTIPSSFGTTSDPGFRYLRMGRGTQIQNMVFQFEMGWSKAGEKSGCGMVFRAIDNKLENFWYTMLTNDGQFILVHAEDEENAIEVVQDSENFVADRYNFVTIVAIDEKVGVYVNGVLEAVKISEGTIDRGVFAIQVYNDEEAEKKVSTDCRYQNIWAWSFD
jgi:hypothetical protein